MTFVFIGNPIDFTVGKKYRVVFKAKSLVQKTKEGNVTSDRIEVAWPNDPNRSTRSDWGMIYGLGLGLSFVLDNTPDQGKTPGGTEPPSQPSPPLGSNPLIPSPPNVPGAAGEPNYPLSPQPADYCQIRSWGFTYDQPVWGYYLECFKWERSGNGYAPTKTSESFGNVHTFGWYINDQGQLAFGHIQYPWPESEF